MASWLLYSKARHMLFLVGSVFFIPLRVLMHVRSFLIVVYIDLCRKDSLTRLFCAALLWLMSKCFVCCASWSSKTAFRRKFCYPTYRLRWHSLGQFSFRHRLRRVPCRTQRRRRRLSPRHHQRHHSRCPCRVPKMKPCPSLSLLRAGWFKIWAVFHPRFEWDAQQPDLCWMTC